MEPGTGIKIGGIMQSTDLGMIGVMSTPDRPGVASAVMDALGQNSVNVEFIVQCIDIHDNDHVVFCIAQEDLGKAKDILEGVKSDLGAEQVIQRENVAVLSIFGPDFRERPGIAGTMFSALGSRDINILAISTSISTLSCVIDADRLQEAVTAMRETFDLP